MAFWAFRDHVCNQNALVVAKHADVSLRDELGCELISTFYFWVDESRNHKLFCPNRPLNISSLDQQKPISWKIALCAFSLWNLVVVQL